MTHIFRTAAVCLGFICTFSMTKAQEMDQAAMMKAWQNFMTPGDMHKLMMNWEGTWEAEVLSFMDPAAPPQKSTATNTVSSVFNGLYQVSELTGNIMGMPFHGRGTLAYDNAKKVFINTWIDNLGSGIIYMTGTWDAESKTLHLKGIQTDPMTGGDAPIREELKVIDENTQHLTMYGPGMDGGETKFMEATYKRKM